MTASENTPKHGTWKKIVVLFLPKTLAVRLAALTFFLVMVIIIVPAAVSESIVLTYFFLLSLAFVVGVRNSLKQKGNRSVRLIHLIGRLAAAAGIMMAYFAVYYAILTLGALLAFMAAGGAAGSSSVLDLKFDGTLGDVEIYMLIATVVLLVWIPQVFFSIKLDMNGAGDAQRVLLGLITVASCAMTGTYFLLFHFGDGPLRNVNVGTLVVGIIGTVLLVAHPYRSLAKTFWQHGIAGVFSLRALKQRWGNTATELAKALDRTAEHDVTPSSAARPAAEEKA